MCIAKQIRVSRGVVSNQCGRELKTQTVDLRFWRLCRVWLLLQVSTRQKVLVVCDKNQVLARLWNVKLYHVEEKYKPSYYNY